MRLPVLLAAALAAGAALGQPVAQPIQLDVDATTFRYDAEAALVEVYLAFGAASLPFARDGERFVAEVPVEVTVRRGAAVAPAGADEGVVFSEAATYAFTLADTAGVGAERYFMQRVRAAVPPGAYELEVAVPPLAGRPSLAVRRDLAVPDFGRAGAGRAMVSDVLLASQIRPSDDRDSPFWRNGLAVQPNPNGLYGQGVPRVFYYAEAYGLDDAVPAEAYTLLAYVAASNLPQPLPDLQQRTSRPVRPTEVVVGAFDVSALPSGSYYLRLAFLNAENEAVAEQSRRFFVFNPGVQRPVAAVDQSYETMLYAAMLEDEIAENLLHAETVATPRERRQIRQLASDEARRTFLAEFWRQRDENPGTPGNDARRTFYERLQYANDRYSAAGRDGWRTERGRVLLRYGYPSAVNPRPFDSVSVAHEVWEYDNIPGEGRSMFVFADRTGSGDYELVHSDVTGEISQMDWERRLRR